MSKSSVRWTEQEYAQYLKRNRVKVDGQLPNPKPKRDKAAALGGVAEGKEESFRRITIKFTGYRVKCLDPDNFAGSCKDLLDGIKATSLIPDDSPEFIKLETEQVRVASFAQERTEIEIHY
jgi:hypothetical protein